MKTCLFVFLGRFPGQAGGVFVGALAEAALEAAGQGDAGFTVTVTQMVNRQESLLPAFGGSLPRKAELLAGALKSRGINA